MRSNVQVEALLLRIADETQGCDVVVETERSAVRMWLRCTSSRARVASVSRIDESTYSLRLDHLYAMAWVDEDLSLSEEEEILRRLVRIGRSYVMQGGAPGRASLLRAPYLEVVAEDESVRVYRPFGWRSGVLLSPWERVGG